LPLIRDIDFTELRRRRRAIAFKCRHRFHESQAPEELIEEPGGLAFERAYTDADPYTTPAWLELSTILLAGFYLRCYRRRLISFSHAADCLRLPSRALD